MSTRGSPVRVLHLREALVDLIDRHQFLLAASAVRTSGNRFHGDGVDVFAARQGTVARIVSEAVFDSYDNPVMC